MAAERFAVALVLLAAAGPLAAAELGTLFHSPEERARLDRLRRGEPATGASQPGTEAAAPQLPEVTGFVRRSLVDVDFNDSTNVATESQPEEPNSVTE